MRPMPLMTAVLALATALLPLAPGRAQAVDGMLYEVTEVVELTNGTGSFKSSEAMLIGSIRSGTPLCPAWLATSLGAANCTVAVRAVGRADDVTGIGPVTGTLYVLANKINAVDAAEVKILEGTLVGTMDMSPAFQAGVPRGSIVGTYQVAGTGRSLLAGRSIRGGFSGTFRLPFSAGGRPSYLLDSGEVVAVQSWEHSVGVPTVRLEIVFTGATRIAY